MRLTSIDKDLLAEMRELNQRSGPVPVSVFDERDRKLLRRLSRGKFIIPKEYTLSNPESEFNGWKFIGFVLSDSGLKAIETPRQRDN